MRFVVLSASLPQPAPFLRRMAAVLAGLVLTSLASAQLYWDPTNGSTMGTGSTTPTGAWNTSGSNKTWNSDSLGTNNTVKWTDGNQAVFSAGSDATGSYTVTVGTVSASAISVEEGSPIFSGGTITLSSPSFTVASGATATVNSGLAGTAGLTKLGAGTLILGTSDKAYSGTTTISLGTLQTNFDQTFSTVTLGGGTLALASASTTITTLNLSANSTIDFSGANASLLLTTLNLNGFTLNITGWTAAADHFYATNWAGVTKDVYDNAGATPVSLVQFQGYGANQTGWDSYNNEIRPNVPEPSTYGALLLGALTGLFAWRRLVRRPAR